MEVAASLLASYCTSDRISSWSVERQDEVEFIGQNTRKSVTSAQIEAWAEWAGAAFVQCSLGSQHKHITLTVFRL